MSRFSRSRRNLPYRRTIVFLTEGEKTEECYLRLAARLLELREACNMSFPFHSTDVTQLLDQAVREEKSRTFNPDLGDEVWVVLDRDEYCHLANHFRDLNAWEQGRKHRRSAISTPRFEYWLLLHVMPHPTKSQALSDSFVAARIPNFKHLPLGTTIFSPEDIKAAMNRAINANSPTPANPDQIGTGMGLLIQHLLDLKDE